MSGISLLQPNGAGLLNAAGASHPAPVTIENNLLCQLGTVGVSTTTWRWSLSRPSGSASILSSSTSAGPSFMPDVENGAYSITLTDIDENVYVLDIVVATVVEPGNSGGSSVQVTLNTYADVRAASFGGTTPPASFMVKGRAAAGDGGEGQFIYLPDGGSSDNDGTVLEDGDGNVFSRVFTGPIDVRWFGVKAYTVRNDASGGTDSTAALQAALDAAGPLSAATDYISREVLLPYGYIRIAGQVEIRRRVHLRGHGKAATWLMTDNTSDCIRINGSGLTTDGGTGDYASCSNFSISTFNGSGTKRGVVINAPHASIERMSFGSLGGAAVQIGVPLVSSNTHTWHASDITISNCGGRIASSLDPDYSGNASWWVQYGNAGNAYGLSIIGGNGTSRGFVDQSNLGNKYWGSHCEATPGATCVVGDNLTSRTQLFGPYLEGPGAEIHAPASVFGGYPSNTYAAGTDGTALIIQDVVTAFSHQMRSGSGADEVAYVLGAPDGDSTVFGWATISPIEKYTQSWDSTNKVWRASRNGSSAEADIVWEHTVPGHTRHWAHMRAPNLLIGNSGTGKGVRWTSSAAEPSAGIWYVGDGAWNSATTLGGSKGWVCTTRGGFGSARVNDHVYSRYDLITVSARVYECVVSSGRSALSPPTFNHASLDDTTTDGTVTWRYHGADPPVFDTIGAAGTPGTNGTNATPTWSSQGIAATTSFGFSGADITLTNTWSQFDITYSGLSPSNINLKNAGATQGNVVELSRTDDSVEGAAPIKNNGGTTIYDLTQPAAVGGRHWAKFVYTGSDWEFFGASGGV